MDKALQLTGVVALATLSSCINLSKETLADKPLPVEIKAKLPELSNARNADSSDLDLEENLFGKFFHDRAEFYVIDQPNNTMMGSPIESMTLFYLDGELSKTKYILTNDISDQLLRKVKTFTIRGYDQKNKELVSNNQILASDKNKRMLHSELTNFRLQWSDGFKICEWRVNRNIPIPLFVYSEKTKGYETAFIKLEQLGDL